MSKRTERRAAERLQRKQDYRELRQHQQQEQQQQQQQQDNPIETPNNKRELNALKHGSCSETLLLPSESMDDYLAHENRWFKAYGVHANSPETTLEAELVRNAARADWLFLRADRNFCDVERLIHTEQPEIRYWSNIEHQAIQRFMRYRTAHANSAARHRKTLEDYLKARAAERANVIKTTTSEVTREIAKCRLLKLEQQAKVKPPLSKQEESDRLNAAIRAARNLQPRDEAA